MPLYLREKEEDVLLELGGGGNPLCRPRCLGGKDVNMDCRMAYLPDGRQAVDIVHDLNQLPLPIQDAEFDGILSHYSLEHASWRVVPSLIKDIHRILKPGGRVLVVTANTEAQLAFIQSNPTGWDGKNFFESASCLLMGDQDYQANAHASFFSPSILANLFKQAGFNKIIIQPAGTRWTDLTLEAWKV